ncbi:uncharacterized protein LOC107359905 isoform X2 [Tetranychus urticae]|uniref:uncharacterized protein LOC107359905 isoform X2 n=1 Tax=Tetranychus urticae TaxID=32264 RepID=UPI00077BB75D|nr:uncharacterized protein LOC107359905 isoform X2 [Tetranychus urticae]
MTLFHNLILLCIQSGSLLSNVIVTVNLNESLSLPLSSSSLLSSSPSSQPTDDLEISSDKVNTKDSQLENEQSRVRRDEFENVGRAFGRGMGYYLGEPCIKQCNAILFHIYCNITSQKCECLPEYPVNLDNRICIKALKLGDKCEDHFSCSYRDIHAICSSENRCRCDYGFYPVISKSGETRCTAGLSMYYSIVGYSNFVPFVAIIVAIIFCTGVVFIGVRMIGKSQGDSSLPTRDRAISPVPVKLGGLELLASMSRPSSLRSASNEYLPGSRRPSYSMLAPPTNYISRRPSSSSGTSFRSYSSFRSQSSFRNYRGNYCYKETLKYNTPRTPSPIINPSNVLVGEPLSKETCAVHSNPEINRSESRRHRAQEDCLRR